MPIILSISPKYIGSLEKPSSITLFVTSFLPNSTSIAITLFCGTMTCFTILSSKSNTFCINSFSLGLIAPPSSLSVNINLNSSSE